LLDIVFVAAGEGYRQNGMTPKKPSLVIGNDSSVAKDSQSQVYPDKSLWRLSFSFLLDLFFVAAVDGNGQSGMPLKTPSLFEVL
jgi:hypothetical protein